MNYKPLHPEVVALLEESERLRLFFLSYAQGILTHSPLTTTQSEDWTYTLDSQKVVIYASQANGLAMVDQIDIFDLIKKWIVGKDMDPVRREVVRINWNLLRERVLKNELNDPNTKVKYTENSDENNPNSMINLIQQCATQGIQNLNQNQVRFFDAHKYSDLVNLAKVIYLERVK